MVRLTKGPLLAGHEVKISLASVGSVDGHMKLRNGISAFAPFLLIFVFAAGTNLSAVTVTNTNDNGAGSLRNALIATAAGGTVNFALSGCPCTITLTSGDLEITKNLTIIGPGPDQLTISGNNVWRPFRIGAPYTLPGPGPPTITVDLNDLKIADGLAGLWPSYPGLDGQGGGILSVDTNLTVRRSVITNNVALRGGGGILTAGGNVTIVGSAISNNVAGVLDSFDAGSGGGIYFQDNSSFSLIDSVVSGNRANFIGGGVFCDWYTSNQIINTTISGNDAEDGSGFDMQGNSTAQIVKSTISGNTGGYSAVTNVTSIADIKNSTISGNSGIGLLNFNYTCDFCKDEPSLVTITSSTIYGNGAGVVTEFFHGDTVPTKTTIKNSIIAASQSGPDIISPYDPGFGSLGYNLIGNSGSETVFTQTGDKAGTPTSPLDPRLEPLAFNGGLTKTHALGINSPAIDRGNAFGSISDQRGLARPYDYADRPNAPGGDGSDIGAFEGHMANTAVRLSPFDFDGDGKTDIGITRPNNGVTEWWLSRSSDTNVFATVFGLATDIRAPADFTGDGKADIAVFRPSNGNWFILRSEDFTFLAFPFGTDGDLPMPADYDGDGKADPAVFRPSSSTWFINRSSDNQTTIAQFGAPGDQPVAADYDGDGKADIAIYRQNNGAQEWWIQRSTAGLFATVFGASGDKAVPGDYTGDGKTDVAVWRPSNGNWFILRSEDFSYLAFPWGTNGDIPAPGDYDGDGKTDAAVFRPSPATWFVNRTGGSGPLITNFGAPTDSPVAGTFVR
jgi:hypothetical protein